MPSSNFWQRYPLQVVSRPMRNSIGEYVSRPSPGGIVFHWGDFDLARAWFEVANRLVNDNARIRSLLERTDANAQFEQARYVYEIVSAIANGYNALNIVWSNDPEARWLYRKYWAGMPAERGGNYEAAEFSPNLNYNNLWFDGEKDSDRYFPVVTDRDRNKYGCPRVPEGQFRPGLLSLRSLQLFRQLYPRRSYADIHPVEVHQRAGLFLDFADGSSRSRSVSTAEFAQNRPFVLMPAVRACGPGENQTWDLSNNVFKCEPVPPSMTCRFPDGSPCLASTAFRPVDGFGPPSMSYPPVDWRTFWFDQAFESFGTEWDPCVPLAVGPPLYEHLPWLREWVATLISRRPSQIVLDARAYAVYRNEMQIRSIGQEAFLTRFVTVESDVRRQQEAPQPEFQVAAAAATALGSALAANTYGISALVGGAISAIITLVDIGTTGPVRGQFKDDLGRWKPTLERGWLSGNPAFDDPLSRPYLDVPAPDGWRRPIYVGVPISAILQYGGRTAPSTPPPGTTSRGSGVLALALGAGAVYVGYRLLSRGRR